jgi:hypothetical protein
MAEDSQLDVRQTFQSQRDLVNNILIPTLQSNLGQLTFSVDDNILYDIVHARHRHQRESYLLRLRDDDDQDRQARRKHKNARARDVSDRLIVTFIAISSINIVLYAYRKGYAGLR